MVVTVFLYSRLKSSVRLNLKNQLDCYVHCLALKCVIIDKTIHKGAVMRTNIVIDDNLMIDVLQVTGLKTKREAVELGLKTLIRLKKQEEIKQFKGKLKWDDDLERMRTD